MTKTQFRTLLIFIIILAFSSGLVDFVWPDEITDYISACAEKVAPEWSDNWQIFFGICLVLDIVCLTGSFIGLALFKNWGRILLLMGFIFALPLYWSFGTTISSPLSQLLYDLTSLGEGAILVLCYFSPVAKYFEK